MERMKSKLKILFYDKIKHTRIEIALQTSPRMSRIWKKRNFMEEEIYSFFAVS